MPAGHVEVETRGRLIQNSNLLRSENYEQGTSRDRSRRVEAYRRIEEGAFSKGLWIRHVKGHSNHAWNNVADKLAGDGNFKRRTHCGPPWTLGPLVGGH